MINNKKMNYLISDNLKDDFKLEKNIIVVTGHNGIGKSYFFKKPFVNFNVLDLEYIHETLIGEISNKIFIKKENYMEKENFEEKFLKQIKNDNERKMYLYNDEVNKNWINVYESTEKRILGDSSFNLFNIKSYNRGINYGTWEAYGKFSDIGPITNFNIFDINSILNQSIKEKFSDLFRKFKKAFSKYGRIYIKNDIKRKNKNFSDEKIIRMIELLNGFFNNKVIQGLSEDLNNILFIDKNSKNKEPQNLSPDVLSDGEKKIFALASLFLENDKNNNNVNNFYIWDEPENSLHANWQNKILEFLKKSLNKNDYLLMISHSTHIIAQSYVDKDISLIKFNRAEDFVSLKKLELKDDWDLKVSLSLNAEQIENLSKTIGNDTLIVEGESDEIYLKAIFDDEELNIMVAGSNSKSKELQKIIPYIHHLNKNSLLLFDNDWKGKNNIYKEGLLNGEYSYDKDKIHFLVGLKWGEDIEKYFEEIISGITNDEIEFEDKKYQIIHKNNVDNFIIKVNGKDNDRKLKELIEKASFVSSDKIDKNCEIKLNTNNSDNVWVPSKIVMAKWLFDNKIGDINKLEKFNELKKSIKKYFNNLEEDTENE